MDTKLFTHFAPVIQNLTTAELAGALSLREKLSIATQGDLQVCYAPFEFINTSARVVLVGITPGRQQMLNAVNEARRQLDSGANVTQVLYAAKSVGAFSGPIRRHLVNLLDYIGIGRWLSLSSCGELFGKAAGLVQTTSVLRNPVFIKGKDYNGTPNMTRHPLLREQLLTQFAEDARALPNALFVPLGSKVDDALKFLVERGLIDKTKVLSGLPHPSPQNIERISYFL